MLSILYRWNRWGGASLSAGIIRQVTSRLLPFLHSSEIITLIGPRRAGKTTVLFQIMDVLEKAGIPQQAMLHVNLEEPALSPELHSDVLEKIYRTYREAIYPSGKVYMFIDEIQNIPHWEKWIRSRNESEDIKFFITGSSSQLMSKELATVLTGRHVSFSVFPLSFKEFLHFRKKEVAMENIKNEFNPMFKQALNTYFKWGGFPEIVLAENDERKNLLLKQYFDDILFKDVAMRHAIRDTFALRSIAVFLLTHTGSLISFQRLAKVFEVSLDLARSYCNYLQEAFMVDFLPFYSRKAAERQRNPAKVYALDLGLRNVVSLSASEDKGHITETAVFHQLKRQKHDGIFYVKKENEIDFLIRQGITIHTAIQVAEDAGTAAVSEREVRALTEAKQLFPQAELMLITKKMTAMEKLLPSIEIKSLLSFLLS